MTTILVVEDELNIREEVMDWLRFEGYNVIGAENGRIALETITQAEPDLIISDIRMPEMNGHQLLLEIRSNPDLLHIPFIFLTASAERASVRKGMDIGADDYLTKPFTHAEVLRAVEARLVKKIAHDVLVQTQFDVLNSALGEEREKRLLKSRLVAMFSHDFRNPLASIIMSAGILRNYAHRLTPEKTARQLDRIDGAAHLLLQMLDEMLVVAEMESGHLAFEPQPVELEELVQIIVEEFQLIDQNEHQLVLHSTVRGKVNADPKLLRHALANLLSNALKYSPSKTEVTISLQAQDGTLYLKVQDRGIGIPEESLPHLFDPFYRADNARGTNGTGLGLSILQECVSLHNGQITVESQEDQGSVFTISIPLSR